MSFRPGRALLLLAVAASVNAADLTFSGKLDERTQRSIALRLEDGRVIDALLPRDPPAGAAGVGAGDTIRVVCKKITPIWDQDGSRYRFLEVTGIELLRHGAPERPARFAAPEGAADPILAQARDVNLRYASQLPNYVADESAKRYTRKSDSEKWLYLDKIDTEITVQGARTTRQRVRRNGNATRGAFERLSGFKWYGGFGTEIRPVFDVHCPTRLVHEEDADAAGRHLVEYRFESPAHACFVPFYFEYQRYNPARTGRIDLDPQGRLVRFSETAKEFPPEFEFRERTEEVWWEDVTIGGSPHLLPVKATFVVAYASGIRWRVEVVYSNHRHFEASTNIIPLR